MMPPEGGLGAQKHPNAEHQGSAGASVPTVVIQKMARGGLIERNAESNGRHAASPSIVGGASTAVTRSILPDENVIFTEN